jgi:excisionase family DNA binding protein
MNVQNSQDIQVDGDALSPKDFATAMGVSESSVKRWVDDGRIEALRTPGGHRRIAMGEAVRFVRETGATLARPEMLGLRELRSRDVRTRGPMDPSVQGNILYEALVAGRALEARALVFGSFMEGTRVAALCDGPIRHALARLGELWHHDPAGVFLEHRATAIIVDLLGRLRSLTVAREGAPRAVGCAPSGDPYLVPTLAIAASLGDESFDATNLGPETPLRSLELALHRIRPRLAWVSASTEAALESLSDGIVSLAAAAAECGAALVVGGRALEMRPIRLPAAVLHCRTAAEVMAYARGLQSASPE